MGLAPGRAGRGLSVKATLVRAVFSCGFCLQLEVHARVSEAGLRWVPRSRGGGVSLPPVSRVVSPVGQLGS